ncbi:MAG: bifunctional nicotinamidase/pyrazinamidase [Clostridia bacterium]|nr:bifunctional nicotinamidase/pyrazinamidase [Clostridia bacterium]
MNSLILVDLQNDFLPGGALAVPGGDEIIQVANVLQSDFDMVVATKDWHPPGHGSFASAHPGSGVGDIIDLNGLPQVLWPDHCVQGSFGAEFAPALDASRVAKVFYKGADHGVDSYSGFFDNGHANATGLEDYLRSAGVERVYVMGLATDYCVKYTVIDGLSLGFHVCLIRDGCRGVELSPGDVDKTVSDMRAAGAVIASWRELEARRKP